MRVIPCSPRGWSPQGKGWQYAEMATSTVCNMTGEEAPQSLESEMWVGFLLLTLKL